MYDIVEIEDVKSSEMYVRTLKQSEDDNHCNKETSCVTVIGNVKKKTQRDYQ